MAAVTTTIPPPRGASRAGAVLRHSTKDAWLVAATAACGAGVVALGVHGSVGIVPALAIAVSLWWTSNTVAHVHLHTPIFRARAANRALSLVLSVVTGVPQTVWRQRHLAHHAGSESPRIRLGVRGAIEVAAIVAALVLMIALRPRFALLAYAPGYLLGLALCQMHGALEHQPTGERAPISHYGAFYNFFWCNDGHHVEHHERPGEHWSRLPLRRRAAAGNVWPTFLRFAERVPVASVLGILERLPLASSLVRRWMIAVHADALRGLLRERPRSIAIVGGALFPRTVLALRTFCDAELTVIDASAESIAIARDHLSRSACSDGVTFVRAIYDEASHDDFDVVIFPLAYVGDRDALYRGGRATRLIHDWAFRARGDDGTLVSLFLCKRVNVVRPRVAL